GLGDDPALSHPRGKQHLGERVVQLVGAGVAEVLALEVEAIDAERRLKRARAVERRRPAHVASEQVVQLGAEPWLLAQSRVGVGELVERADHRFRHVAPAEGPEAGRWYPDGRLPHRARSTP